MLLRLSRACFWFAAAAAAVALAVPTGRETLLTGVALCGALAAFGLWRSGLREVRRTEALDALAPEALALTLDALGEAAATIERSCDAAASFESALHSVARILRAELGVRHCAVQRVLRADATHACLSELIESQPGFNAVERRVPLLRSLPGRAISDRGVAGDPPGAVVLPVCAGGGVVALIEMNGIGIDVEARALSALLALAGERLSRLAEPAALARCRPPSAACESTVGKNG